MIPVSERRKREQGGFALLMVFMMAAIVAISLYMQLPRAAFESQRAKEELLVDRGKEYVRGIQLYLAKNKKFPQTLDDLDKNTPQYHYIRHRFADPMTGKDDWRIIHTNGQFLTDSKVQAPPGQGTGDQKAANTFITEAASIGASGNSGPGAVTLANRHRASDSQQLPMPGDFQGGGTNVNPNAPVDPNQQNGLPGAQGANGQNPNGQPPNGQAANGVDQNGQPLFPGMTPQNAQGQQNPNANGQATPNSQTGANGQPGPNGQGAQNGQNNDPAQQQNQQKQALPWWQQLQQQNQNNLPSGSQPGRPLQPAQPQGLGSNPTVIGGGSSPNPNSGGGIGAAPNGAAGANGLPTSGSNPATQAIMDSLLKPRGSTGLGSAVQGSQGSPGIAGVASKFEADSIRVYNERQKYDEWEFTYDAKKDPRNAQMNGMQAQNGRGAEFNPGTNMPAAPIPGSNPTAPGGLLLDPGYGPPRPQNGRSK